MKAYAACKILNQLKKNKAQELLQLKFRLFILRSCLKPFSKTYNKSYVQKVIICQRYARGRLGVLKFKKAQQIQKQLEQERLQQQILQEEQRLEKEKKTQIQKKQNQNAVILQAQMRGYLAFKKVDWMRIQDGAAQYIQSCWRGYICRKMLRRKELEAELKEQQEANAPPQTREQKMRKFLHSNEYKTYLKQIKQSVKEVKPSKNSTQQSWNACGQVSPKGNNKAKFYQNKGTLKHQQRQTATNSFQIGPDQVNSPTSTDQNSKSLNRMKKDTTPNQNKQKVNNVFEATEEKRFPSNKRGGRSNRNNTTEEGKKADENSVISDGQPYANAITQDINWLTSKYKGSQKAAGITATTELKNNVIGSAVSNSRKRVIGMPETLYKLQPTKTRIPESISQQKQQLQNQAKDQSSKPRSFAESLVERLEKQKESVEERVAQILAQSQSQSNPKQKDSKQQSQQNQQQINNTKQLNYLKQVQSVQLAHGQTSWQLQIMQKHSEKSKKSAFAMQLEASQKADSNIKNMSKNAIKLAQDYQKQHECMLADMRKNCKDKLNPTNTTSKEQYDNNSSKQNQNKTSSQTSNSQYDNNTATANRELVSNITSASVEAEAEERGNSSMSHAAISKVSSRKGGNCSSIGQFNSDIILL